MAETTALGAAMAAGFAEGIKVWDLEQLQPTSNDTFNPVITDEGYPTLLSSSTIMSNLLLPDLQSPNFNLLPNS